MFKKTKIVIDGKEWVYDATSQDNLSDAKKFYTGYRHVDSKNGIHYFQKK